MNTATRYLLAGGTSEGEFTIEANVPAPAINIRAGNRRYPFSQMSVGDSFSASAELKQKIASCASHYGKKNNKRFTVRKEGSSSVRVWRLS